mgnify:CR=1 FL=1
MISERKFAGTYTSFWSQLLPRMDTFVRRMNCSCERYCKEVYDISSTHRDRRGIVNELAFRIFQEDPAKACLAPAHIATLAENVRVYIERLSNEHDGVVELPVSDDEIMTALALANSLRTYFRDISADKLIFWPPFPGCGILRACKGDIISGSTLYEIKAGDRSFRVTDVRQILVYCSLDYASKRYGLQSVTLLNPRRGVYYKLSIKSLVEECAGLSPTDLFESILEFISSDTPSR